MVAPAPAAVPVLTRAVAVLQRSPARLEHARALVSLGAALRRAGRQHTAREPLRQGLALADVLGYGPVTAQARDELLASGARPRRIAVIGRAGLTPTERRVADLATAGHTNRQIALQPQDHRRSASGLRHSVLQAPDSVRPDTDLLGNQPIRRPERSNPHQGLISGTPTTAATVTGGR